MRGALHTPADLAEKFGKSERWILEQVRKHGWPRVKVDRTIRFTDEQVSLILSRHTVATEPDSTRRVATTKRTGRRAS